MTDIVDNIFLQKNKKTANMSEYMKQYRKKNVDCWNKDIICPDCGSKFKSSCKSNHIKSMKHQNAVMANKLMLLENTLKNINIISKFNKNK